MKCLQCESDDVLRNLRVVDRGDYNVKSDLKLEVESRPEAMIFRGTEAAAIKANVCCQCGFVMMSIARSKAQLLKKVKPKF